MWMALSGRIVLMSISSVSGTGVGQHALLAQDHFFDFGVVGSHREHGLGVLDRVGDGGDRGAAGRDEALAASGRRT